MQFPTYGKIVNDEFVEAPGIIQRPNGTLVINPSDATLESLEFLPVVVHLPPGYVDGDSVSIAAFFLAPDEESIYVYYEFDDDSSDESGDESSEDDSSEDYPDGALIPFGIYSPEAIRDAYWVEDTPLKATPEDSLRSTSSLRYLYLPAQALTVNSMPVEIQDVDGVFKYLTKGKWYCVVKCRQDGEAVPEGMSPEFVAKMVKVENDADLSENADITDGLTVYYFPVAEVITSYAYTEIAYGGVAIEGLKHISKYVAFEISVVSHKTNNEEGYVYRMYLPKWGTLQCNNVIIPVAEAESNWLTIEKNKTYYCYVQNQTAHVSSVEPVSVNDRVFRIGGIYDAGGGDDSSDDE